MKTISVNWGAGISAKTQVAPITLAQRMVMAVDMQWGSVEPSNSVLTDASGDVFVDALGNIIGAQPTS